MILSGCVHVNGLCSAPRAPNLCQRISLSESFVAVYAGTGLPVVLNALRAQSRSI